MSNFKPRFLLLLALLAMPIAQLFAPAGSTEESQSALSRPATPRSDKSSRGWAENHRNMSASPRATEGPTSLRQLLNAGLLLAAPTGSLEIYPESPSVELEEVNEKEGERSKAQQMQRQAKTFEWAEAGDLLRPMIFKQAIDNAPKGSFAKKSKLLEWFQNQNEALESAYDDAADRIQVERMKALTEAFKSNRGVFNKQTFLDLASVLVFCQKIVLVNEELTRLLARATAEGADSITLVRKHGRTKEQLVAVTSLEQLFGKIDKILYGPDGEPKTDDVGLDTILNTAMSMPSEVTTWSAPDIFTSYSGTDGWTNFEKAQRTSFAAIANQLTQVKTQLTSTGSRDMQMTQAIAGDLAASQKAIEDSLNKLLVAFQDSCRALVDNLREQAELSKSWSIAIALASYNNSAEQMANGEFYTRDRNPTPNKSYLEFADLMLSQIGDRGVKYEISGNYQNSLELRRAGLKQSEKADFTTTQENEAWLRLNFESIYVPFIFTNCGHTPWHLAFLLAYLEDSANANYRVLFEDARTFGVLQSYAEELELQIQSRDKLDGIYDPSAFRSNWLKFLNTVLKTSGKSSSSLSDVQTAVYSPLKAPWQKYQLGSVFAKLTQNLNETPKNRFYDQPLTFNFGLLKFELEAQALSWNNGFQESGLQENQPYPLQVDQSKMKISVQSDSGFNFSSSELGQFKMRFIRALQDLFLAYCIPNGVLNFNDPSIPGSLNEEPARAGGQLVRKPSGQTDSWSDSENGGMSDEGDLSGRGRGQLSRPVLRPKSPRSDAGGASKVLTPGGSQGSTRGSGSSGSSSSFPAPADDDNSPSSPFGRTQPAPLKGRDFQRSSSVPPLDLSDVVGHGNRGQDSKTTAGTVSGRLSPRGPAVNVKLNPVAPAGSSLGSSRAPDVEDEAQVHPGNRSPDSSLPARSSRGASQRPSELPERRRRQLGEAEDDKDLPHKLDWDATPVDTEDEDPLRSPQSPSAFDPKSRVQRPPLTKVDEDADTKWNIPRGTPWQGLSDDQNSSSGDKKDPSVGNRPRRRRKTGEDSDDDQWQTFSPFDERFPGNQDPVNPQKPDSTLDSAKRRRRSGEEEGSEDGTPNFAKARRGFGSAVQTGMRQQDAGRELPSTSTMLSPRPGSPRGAVSDATEINSVALDALVQDWNDRNRTLGNDEQFRIQLEAAAPAIAIKTTEGDGFLAENKALQAAAELATRQLQQNSDLLNNPVAVRDALIESITSLRERIGSLADDYKKDMTEFDTVVKSVVIDLPVVSYQGKTRELFKHNVLSHFVLSSKESKIPSSRKAGDAGKWKMDLSELKRLCKLAQDLEADASKQAQLTEVPAAATAPTRRLRRRRPPLPTEDDDDQSYKIAWEQLQEAFAEMMKALRKFSEEELADVESSKSWYNNKVDEYAIPKKNFERLQAAINKISVGLSAKKTNIDFSQAGLDIQKLRLEVQKLANEKINDDSAFYKLTLKQADTLTGMLDALKPRIREKLAEEQATLAGKQAKLAEEQAKLPSASRDTRPGTPQVRPVSPNPRSQAELSDLAPVNRRVRSQSSDTDEDAEMLAGLKAESVPGTPFRIGSGILGSSIQSTPRNRDLKGIPERLQRESQVSVVSPGQTLGSSVTTRPANGQGSPEFRDLTPPPTPEQRTFSTSPDPRTPEHRVISESQNLETPRGSYSVDMPVGSGGTTRPSLGERVQRAAQSLSPSAVTDNRSRSFGIPRPTESDDLTPRTEAPFIAATDLKQSTPPATAGLQSGLPLGTVARYREFLGGGQGMSGPYSYSTAQESFSVAPQGLNEWVQVDKPRDPDDSHSGIGMGSTAGKVQAWDYAKAGNKLPQNLKVGDYIMVTLPQQEISGLQRRKQSAAPRYALIQVEDNETHQSVQEKINAALKPAVAPNIEGESGPSPWDRRPRNYSSSVY